MTPTEAEHLRDLFQESRKAILSAVYEPSKATLAADDAAVEAFNTALREYTK